MAFMVWRVFMDKYSRLKYAGLPGRCPQQKSITPSKQEPSNLDEIIIDKPPPPPSDNNLARNDLRKSKSRMKLVFKKCKEALIGSQSEDTSPISPGDVQTPSTSWYLDDDCSGSSSSNSKNNHGLESGQEKSNVTEVNACSTTEIMQLPSNPALAELIDKYFGQLYGSEDNHAEYLDHTRPILISQARDILVSGNYQGDLSSFETVFLRAASKIATSCRNACLHTNKVCWSNGWPLSGPRGVVLHLGTLNESILRPGDLYLCIRTEPSVHLCAAWHISSCETNSGGGGDGGGQTIYKPLDPDKDPLTPLALDMLADELPTLLQNLLVSVEHAFCRVPIDELTKFGAADNEAQLQKPVLSPRCSIKRRDVITKSNYRRMNLSGTSTPQKNDTHALDPTSMPLFCLGGSFPHIDSDEESAEDSQNSCNNETASSLPHEITAPKSIQEVPDKLLTSGICLPGTFDRNGTPIISIEADKVVDAGLNCYEIATVLLYYSTIPQSSTPFTIHLVLGDRAGTILDTLDNSLQLLNNNVQIAIILISGPVEALTDGNCLQNSRVHFQHVTNQKILEFLCVEDLPPACGGHLYHDQSEWKEFFTGIEPLQSQCLSAGRRLIQILSDIRASDAQGAPNRRQLHSQHRALTRALMDVELQTLRRTGAATIRRLQDRARRISRRDSWRSKPEPIPDNTAEHIVVNSNNNNNRNSSSNCSNSQQQQQQQQPDTPDYVQSRLNEVIVVFNEVDRAAKRIESLTEQRRERIREMTRQKAVEEEISEVVTWIINDGEQSVNKYSAIALDAEDMVKDNEMEFEKFYFISMKMIAKSKDLQDASKDVESLRPNIRALRDHVRNFSDRLEGLRDRFEGAARLHHLLAIHIQDETVHMEMQRLADKLKIPALVERCRDTIRKRLTWQDSGLPTLAEERRSNGGRDDDEEDTSKMADSGLGGCDMCEGNDQLTRACSCQSFEDANTACGKSNNSDELDEDCFESAKQSLDLSSPLQANAHLYCHASNLQLDMEENALFDQKTQKTLLLIMREMIGTERDYVRSLRYVIDNYLDELLREDIPQALRGQRNVIFGNIERIYDFHQQNFLKELECYDTNPIKVGAAFLRHEDKFYLYALYNKNKPKSDSLMSEYGTRFFKSKQIELQDKMDLASYLLKPVQRMGKYALLLQQLMKACHVVQASGTASTEFTEDLEELQKAEEMVRFQLRHGNDLLAMDSLRDCDVNLKEQGRLLRQNEFLVWEGRGGKKSLRQVFLFEELVLFSKARRFPDSKNLDIFIYKQSIKTSDIGLTAHVGDSPTKFEIWFRKRKPCDTWMLQSMSEDVKNAWTEEVSKLLWKQAKRNREIRMQEMSSMGIGSKPCLDIRPSQDQISDRSISISQLGKTPKFRNSFIGVPPEIKPAYKRPNSIVSVSSGSSGGSSVSTAGSSSGNEVMSKPTLKLNMKGQHRKHQRSTTLVSQCSMESGIIADMISPDELSECPSWPNLHKSNSSVSEPPLKPINKQDTTDKDLINSDVSVHQ